MDPEQEKKLEEALSLTRENNKMLKKLQRSLFWGRALRALYLIIILGVTFGAYYFIQPYLEGVLGVYSDLLGRTEGIQQVGSSLPDIGKLFQGIGN